MADTKSNKEAHEENKPQPVRHPSQPEMKTEAKSEEKELTAKEQKEKENQDLIDENVGPTAKKGPGVDRSLPPLDKPDLITAHAAGANGEEAKLTGAVDPKKHGGSGKYVVGDEQNQTKILKAKSDKAKESKK